MSARSELRFLRWLWHHPEFGHDPDQEEQLFELFQTETGIDASRIHIREWDEGVFDLEDDDSDSDDRFPPGFSIATDW